MDGIRPSDFLILRGESMKKGYLCKFEFEGQQLATDGESLLDFKNGFWVNESFDFTNCSDAKYWIPPSKILFIVKG